MEKSPEIKLYSGLFGRSGFRYVQTFLLFFGITAALFVRANVGIAVVAITDVNSVDTYEWTFDEKQLILSTFYWGYIVTQIPGGYAAQKLGSKVVLLLSILISSLLSLLTPVSIVYGGWKAYCVIRILQGLFQGVMLPSIYDHLAKWSPKEERNLQGTLALSGYSCGLVFGMGISGVIAASTMKWPGIFYMSGAIGILWSILWVTFGASSPSTSRFITEKEKKFIESSQKEDNQHSVERKQSIPWRKIFTSPPFLALLFVSCCQSFGTFITSVEIPLYFDAILKLDIENNALFSSLSQVFTWGMSYVFLVIAQYIMKQEILSLTALRKSYNLIAFVVPMLVFISLGFLDSNNTAIAVTLIIVIAGISASHEIAYWLNIVDLSPNYTAILFSIANVAATLVDLISPLVVGFIISEQEDSRERWQIVFGISAIIVPVGGMIFLFFGKTDTQPWNSTPKNDNDLEIS
ncbi:hypothetical protein ACFFRR_008316 [Megaselia abdita]